jgi:iron(III) transport system substrate-binding protein
MATLIKTSPGKQGADLVRKIAALQPSLRKGHVLLASLVAAGEVPVGLAMYKQQHRDT